MKLISRIFIVCLAPLAANAGDFRVGAAQVAITPPAGTPMAGYYAFRAVNGVRDPIYSKAIVFEQDGARAAFVVLDLAGTTRDEVALVSLPGEIFVELGRALKAASPFRHTFIAELANGSIGYVPNRESYPQGNYEIVSARGEAGSGEKLVETALQLLNEVRKR